MLRLATTRVGGKILYLLWESSSPYGTIKLCPRALPFSARDFSAATTKKSNQSVRGEAEYRHNKQPALNLGTDGSGSSVDRLSCRGAEDKRAIFDKTGGVDDDLPYLY